jgi:hypothetical protein
VGIGLAQRQLSGGDMAGTQQRVTSWDRVEDVLVATKPGNTLSVGRLVRRTGLSTETAGMVLDALARAELFVKMAHGVFRRRSLLDDRCQER